MNTIIFPLKLRMKRPEVADLQDALQLLLDRGVILKDDETTRRELSTSLQPECAEQRYGSTTRKLVNVFHEELHLESNGCVDEPTAIALNRLIDELTGPYPKRPEYLVKGKVSFFDGFHAAGVQVSAFGRDLRSEQLLGQSRTDSQGFYRVQYSANQFSKSEKGSADLAVKAFAADGSLLVASSVLFNAPPVAEVDLTIPAEKLLPPTLFERIDRSLPPLLEGLKVEELEEDEKHQDLSFLCGETGFEKAVLARFEAGAK